jgi:hypothetical protein
VQEHNSRIPHSAFRGQTPDEMYFGTGSHVPAELETARRQARQRRAETNRTAVCHGNLDFFARVFATVAEPVGHHREARLLSVRRIPS